MSCRLGAVSVSVTVASGMMEAICNCADIPVGEGRYFKRLDADAILAVHLVGGRFLAYEDCCSHFGVPLGVSRNYRYIDGGDIVCQVHYARYAAEDGHCLRGVRRAGPAAGSGDGAWRKGLSDLVWPIWSRAWQPFKSCNR